MIIVTTAKNNIPNGNISQTHYTNVNQITLHVNPDDVDNVKNNIIVKNKSFIRFRGIISPYMNIGRTNAFQYDNTEEENFILNKNQIIMIIDE